ncbi:hypothetical protein HDE_06920 [Halotydeus destructor]|nr:hypothetical protein HDE_06920 [Halotydeus destructor]
MTWKLLVVMVCLTAHMVQAVDMDLLANVFSLIGVILDLLSSPGNQGSPLGTTSSGREDCSGPAFGADVCGYYQNTAACDILVGCVSHDR